MASGDALPASSASAGGGDDDEEEEDVGALAARELRKVNLKRPAPDASGDASDADCDAKRLAPSASTREEGEGESVTYRLLVSVRRAEALSGEVPQQLQEATGALVRVLDPTAGCDEQVVEVVAPPNGAEEHPAQVRATLGPFSLRRLTHAPQLAALAVFKRCLGDAAQAPEEAKEPAQPEGRVTARLLVLAAQAGGVIGRAGEHIRSVREASGAVVRVLDEADNPGCSGAAERVVSMSGSWDSVSKALKLVLKYVREHPAKGGREGGASQGKQGSRSAPARPAAQPTGYAMQPMFQGWAGMHPLGMGYMAPGSASPARGGGASPSRPPHPSATFSAHMAVPEPSVGSIIGKAGTNIAQIRHISGARIKVHDSVPGSTERRIEMTGTGEQVAHAQVLVQGFLMTAGSARGGSGAAAAALAQPQQPQVMMMPVMMGPGGVPMLYGAPMGMGMGASQMYGMHGGGAAQITQMMQMQQMQMQMAQRQQWGGPPPS